MDENNVLEGFDPVEARKRCLATKRERSEEAKRKDEENKKILADFVENVIRPNAVTIWERVKELFANKETRPSPYICYCLLPAIAEVSGGRATATSGRLTIDGRVNLSAGPLISVAFPEFPAKFDQDGYGVFTINSLRAKYGWFGKPNDENDEKRKKAIDEMIDMYKFLKDNGLC